jgi:hypothetical protein
MDRYGLLGLAISTVEVSARVSSGQDREGLSELAKELEAVMEEKDVKGFTVAFAKALAVFGRLPQHTTDALGGNLLGNNLGLCMTKVIADCKAAGFACYVDATGLHFAEKAVKS